MTPEPRQKKFNPIAALAIIPGLAWLLWVEYKDAITSKMYPLYETGEANWWARGKDGYFSLSASIRNTSIAVGGLLAITFGSPYLVDWEGIYYIGYVTAGLFGAMGGIIWTVVSKNARKLKEQKARQFDILENFVAVKDTQIEPFKDAWVYSPGTSMGGGTTFYDIRVAKLGHVDNTHERIRAATVLTERFLKLKAKPEIWWDLERAKKV